MNVFDRFRRRIVDAVESLIARGELPSGLDLERIVVEPPREAGLGDLATNVALVLAKPAKMRALDLAALVATELGAAPEVVAAEVAGPGFVNLRLSDSFWQERLLEILEAGPDYGITNLGEGRKINVEYVSANPTGPLHVGHGRGAVYGDALANLLERVGFDVTREYYVNDAGAQVEVLAESTAARYGEALGVVRLDEEALQGLYPGEYLKPVGEKLAKAWGDKWQKAPEEERLPFFIEYAVDEMMALIRGDLAALGIEFDLYTSERKLVAEKKVQHAVQELERRGLVYTGMLEPPKGKAPPEDWEPKPQLLFRSTRFGDDIDRPLKKSDGSWTYFAADMAYHLDKFERGFLTMIDVWGADHAGYIKRMKAAVEALTDRTAELDIKVCQLVNLFERGEPLRMSKRAGAFVSLREVIEAVGKDVVRFIMLTRKNDAPLEFDLAKVTEQSKDNPVFYVQYAHARVCSVMRNVAAEMPDLDLSLGSLKRSEVGRLTDPSEIGLIRLLTVWPRTIEGAALAHEPHRIAFYLYELASAFHLLWTKGKEDPRLRFIMAEDPRLTLARLALIKAVGLVIASGLRIFGVEPLEEMR